MLNMDQIHKGAVSVGREVWKVNAPWVHRQVCSVPKRGGVPSKMRPEFHRMALTTCEDPAKLEADNDPAT